ncbi:MAG: membrane protein insertase YidC [Legionellales bacterium]|nr:membrane protein insertase YidC [Legionellales bacterium]
MDIRRVILYAALTLVAYNVWMAWQADYPRASAQHVSTVETASTEPSMPNHMIQQESTTTALTEPKKNPVVGSSEAIQVKTDVLDLAIDLQHGDIINAKLLDYPQQVDEKDTPFTLLQNSNEERYVANSNLFVVKDKNIENADGHYKTAQLNVQFTDEKTPWVVTLTGQNAEGVTILKEFHFTKGSYLIDVRYVLENNGQAPWKGYMNTQFLRSSPNEDKSSMFHVGSFTGASYSEPGVHRYQKINFANMSKSNLNINADGGWIAMQQHYFLSAWVPEQNAKNNFYTRAVDGDYTIGAVSQPIVLAPQQKATISAKLYLGPEITSVLKSIAPGLDLTVDYGWLWFLSSLLFSLMKAIYSVVGNWGWSIVLVTVLIKLAFYRLSATSYKSMAGMRKLQPKLLALRERYGDDKAKISQATMALYKEEKVNPLGGCLPIVIQIPVFIALYWVLLESVELRQAPFMFWLKDLAMADPYHILPIIMGGTMLIQQRLNPAPPDPMQAKVMMFLPILFTGLFWNFPAGLVLYWIVNNSLSILQQWYITRKYSDDKTCKIITAQ